MSAPVGRRGGEHDAGAEGGKEEKGGSKVAAEEEIVSYMCLGTRFDVPERYVMVDSVGQGAYGVVCAAQDKKRERMVAIKRIESVFEHAVFTKRTLRELKILRLMDHENVIKLWSILRPVSVSDFSHVYAVFEIMETDLASIIKSPQPLGEEHSQFFLYQILRGIKYIHSRGIVHRDLKPRNLLVNANCDLKICDFGLARSFHHVKGGSAKAASMTDYVATRWYRSPEILLSFPHYTTALDMWSIGCILSELLARAPLFPGNDSQHQLELIIRLLGTPSEHTLSKIQVAKARDFVDSLLPSSPSPWRTVVPDASPESVDLLSKLLVFDPDDRPSAEEALAHDFMSALHFPEDEPTGTVPAQEYFEFEHCRSTEAEYRELLVDEIRRYYREDGEDVNFDALHGKTERPSADASREGKEGVEKAG